MTGKPRLFGNPVEGRFWQLAEEKGWEVRRGGWPDFFICANDNHFPVEVKSANDVLSDAQVELFEALERAGIHVVVWWELTPSRLIPWKRFMKLTERIRKSDRVAKAGSLPKKKPVSEYWTKKQARLARRPHRR